MPELQIIVQDELEVNRSELAVTSTWLCSPGIALNSGFACSWPKDQLDALSSLSCVYFSLNCVFQPISTDQSRLDRIVVEGIGRWVDFSVTVKISHPDRRSSCRLYSRYRSVQIEVVVFGSPAQTTYKFTVRVSGFFFSILTWVEFIIFKVCYSFITVSWISRSVSAQAFDFIVSTFLITLHNFVCQTIDRVFSPLMFIDPYGMIFSEDYFLSWTWAGCSIEIKS